MSIPKDAEKIAQCDALALDFAQFQETHLRHSTLADALKAPTRRMPLTDEVLQLIAGRGAAEDGPPSNNMGGNPPLPPLFLSQCEIDGYLVSPQKTKIDWLAYTTEANMDAVKMGVSVLWGDVQFAVRSGGVRGYPKAMDVIVGEVTYGVIGYGAEHGRQWVSLTGVGCSTLSHEAICNAVEMLLMLDARLTRVDIALDFYNGEVTWDHAYRAYQDTDQFSSRAGGKKPRGKWIEGVDCEGRNSGRTLYIGQRGESEKFLRIYEKGLEVFAKLPKEMRDASDSRELVFSVDDHQFADRWLRIEGEFTRQKRDLPVRMLLERDEYFAGTCPYLANAVGKVDGKRPVGLKDPVIVDLIKLMANGRRAYGSVIHTLKELGFTDAEVVQYMSSGRNNNKLVRSGMLAKIKARQAEILAQVQDWDIPF